MSYSRYASVRRLPELTLALAFFVSPVGAVDLEQSATVTFHDMPWGRTAEITIEFLPSADAALQAFNNPAKQAEMLEAMLAEEGSNPPVVILIPGLEYGMSGTFEKVRIESGEGISVPPDGRIGSRLAASSTEYTGTVTISEFTEQTLRGSYSAALYREDMTDREIRARQRDFIRNISGIVDVSLAPPDAAHYLEQAGLPTEMAEIPDELSPEDQKLLERIRAAGVPPETQGQMLEMMRGMDDYMVEIVLDSYDDTY